jgi:DNA gyrase subunit A
VVLNHLFSHTSLQVNFSVNNLALVDGRPKLLNLKDLLKEFIKHRQDVIRRRSEFDLRKAREREHILIGLKIALENIDEIVEIIKKSRNRGFGQGQPHDTVRSLGKASSGNPGFETAEAHEP